MKKFLTTLALLAALMLNPAAGTQALAALTCTATITNIAFGSINVRDAPLDRTTGTVSYSCTGGTASAAVWACLTLGTGTGGAAAGNSPRYMRRSDNASLDYALKSVNQNGSIWNSVTTTNTLNGAGARNFSATIYGQVTSTGTAIRGGSYSSSFSGANAAFSYGQGNCNTTGTSPSFNVTATVTPSCSIAVTPMNFGSMRSLAAAVNATSTITANCTNGLAYAVALSLGNGSGVTDPAARKMTSGVNTMTYGLYQNAARTTVWGPLTTNDLNGTGTGAAQTLTVYGRIPSQSTPSPGTYSDTVVVTITY